MLKVLNKCKVFVGNFLVFSVDLFQDGSRSNIFVCIYFCDAEKLIIFEIGDFEGIVY